MCGFLDLPYEIRTEIYRLCLEKGTIELEEFYTNETSKEWIVDRTPLSLKFYIAEPDEKPDMVYNGISYVQDIPYDVPIDGRSCWTDEIFEKRERTYRISRKTNDAPCLEIFYANRFIYLEAARFFYERNQFVFPSERYETTLKACSAFIDDRPESALAFITNMRIEVGCVRYNHPSKQFFTHRPTFQSVCEALSKLKYCRRLEVAIEEHDTTQLRPIRFGHQFVSMHRWLTMLKAVTPPQTLEIQIDEFQTADFREETLINNIHEIDSWLLFDWDEFEDYDYAISTYQRAEVPMRRAQITWPSQSSGSRREIEGLRRAFGKSREAE